MYLISTYFIALYGIFNLNYIEVGLNNNLISTLVFLWVNVNYKFLFFIYVIIIIPTLGKSSSNLRFCTLLLTLLMYNLNMNYLVSNQLNLNNLLINRVNAVHPPLLYVSIGVLLLHILSTLGFKFDIGYNVKDFIDSTVKLLYNGYKFNVIAIVLGSWWAFQEGTWGGWWAWDPSEMLNLTLLLTIITLTHILRGYYKPVGTVILNVQLLILIQLNYLFLQLNFSLTSHNFGLTSNVFTDIYWFEDLLRLLGIGSLVWVILVSAKKGAIKFYIIILKLGLLGLYTYSNYDLINYSLNQILTFNTFIINTNTVLTVLYVNLLVFICRYVGINLYTLLNIPLITLNARVNNYNYKSKQYIHLLIPITLSFSLVLTYFIVNINDAKGSAGSHVNLLLYEFTYLFQCSINTLKCTSISIESLNYYNFQFYVIPINVQVNDTIVWVLNYMFNLNVKSIPLNLTLYTYKLPLIAVMFLLSTKLYPNRLIGIKYVCYLIKSIIESNLKPINHL